MVDFSSEHTHSDDSASKPDGAFERLFRTHYVHLRNYGRRFASQAALVEDAIQDVFLALWRSDTSVEDLDHPRSYLLTALRRRLLQYVAKERTRRDHHASFAEEAVRFAMSQEDLLAAYESTEARRGQLKSAVETLSERRREALYLRFYHGLAHDEIAHVMDIANQTARNYVSEALQHLRAHIRPVDVSS